MLCYTVSRNFSTEKHPKLSEIRSGRKNSRAEENSQHLEQGNHCKDPKPLGGVGYRPVINLKHLNQFITYQHFKMESFHCLENIFKNGDYMCKLHLRDAYFSVPLNPVSRKFVWVFLVREVLLVFFFAFVLD